MIRTLRSLIAVLLLTCAAFAQSGGELRFCIHTEPKTFNPVLVAEDGSETVRYLTGGVLVRFNRRTQQVDPELATSWKVSDLGRKITFTLRTGVVFSDGTPFGPEDVAYTMKQLMDPALHSPTGDSFRSGQGEVKTTIMGKNKIVITFPAPVAGLDKLFDDVAIMSSHSPEKERAVLGPFMLADYKPGNYVLLKRNPHYWKHDESGRQLPYLDTVRLDIQTNRDLELMRFKRGEIQLINAINADYFDRLAAEEPQAVRDSGPSLDTEQMWFNQAPTDKLPAFKLAWFRSTNFRRAVSFAINRQDIARLVYSNHAAPAVGPVPPANHFWFNSNLKAYPFDRNEALRLLSEDGFKFDGTTLRDREGHPVEFSILTNAGRKDRERMAALIQQDLAAVGIKVNLVTLDFPSVIERITRTLDYESCLLGFMNGDLDPNSQMNVWLSSGDTHQWNPGQKTPATAWEAEIDKLMRAQASTIVAKQRKQYFDRVQQIAWEQQPFIYLVNKNALSAVATTLHGADPVVLHPETYWNIERLSFTTEQAKK